MEENLNIFGKNQEEIGSLDKNLVLRTKGRVYIRYGRKYIELLDDKGNLKISIPKIPKKVNSLDEIKTNGIYLYDDKLYAYVDGDLIQITGIEGNYIQYEGDQNLSQDQISTAQSNIGLTFNSIEAAKKVIKKGIVFVGNDIVYIEDENTVSLLTTLNSPIKEINTIKENPAINNSAIIYTNGVWNYERIVTYPEFEELINQINNQENENEEDEESDDIFDPIQYSKVYILKSSEIVYQEPENENDEYTIIEKIIFTTEPSCEMQDGDIAIISFYGTKCKLLSQNGQYLQPEYIEIKDSEGDISYQDVRDVLTLNFRYKENALYLIDNDGNETLFELKNMSYYDPDGEEVEYIEYNNKFYAFPKGLEKELQGHNLYVKAESENPYKFKIDYAHAEIALEENYPTNSEGKTKEEKAKPKIIPHTVLGDLDDKSEYYNSPAKSFRTYQDKENSQGLYSDQAVFNGAEFRQPLDYEEPEEPENSEEEKKYTDVEVYNFPRYSKTLDEILCTKHQEIEDGDDFDDVIPTIRWIKNNSAKLNEPLNEINKIDSTHLEAETVEEKKVHIIEEADEEHGYVILSRPDGTWGFFNLGKWMANIGAELQKFTVSWYLNEGDETPYTTTQVNNNTTATAPSTNPTKKHYKFLGWDYDGSPITKDTSIYAKWEYISPKVFITLNPAFIGSEGGDTLVSYWVEWDGDLITEGITVVGKYSNITYEDTESPYIEYNKVNHKLTIKESQFSVLGKINFTASFEGEYGDIVTATATLQQRPAGALALPEFDLMKFSMEWTNIVDAIPENSFQYGNSNWKWEDNKLYELVDGSWVESERTEAWKQESDSKYKAYIRNDSSSAWYNVVGDLDTYTYVSGANIPITEEKTLEQYPVGFRGNSRRTINGLYLQSDWTVIVRKDVTKLFDPDYEEFTEENITSGKDIYDAYQYLTWSGDNINSGGEYTVVNFKKTVNNIVRSGQKAVFFYIKAGWYRWNGFGDFNVAYNIYKLNSDDKGLVSPKSEYVFNPEDSSVEELEVSSNKLLGLHNIKDSGSGTPDVTYGNPVATLYYDLTSKEITFIRGYYTENDIYGSTPSDSEFTWIYPVVEGGE